MPQTVEDLLVRIDATTETLRRELKRGEQEVVRFGTGVDSKLAGIDKSFSKLSATVGSIRGIVAPLAAALGGLSLAGLARNALNLADNLQDTAEQLGISTDALQTYQFAAAETGVSNEQMVQAIQKLNTAIGEAASGQESAQKKFKALGIAFADGAGQARSAEDVLADLADVIKSLPTPAERAAAAAELLGDRAGPKLVTLLRDGASGLRAWSEAADDAGQKMSDETIAALAEAQREIEKFVNWLTIATGETITFFGLFDSAPVAAERLAAVNREIETVQGTLADLRAGGWRAEIAKAFGSESNQVERLNELLREQERLLAKLAPGRTKDDVVGGPVAPAASINLSSDSTKKAAEIREVTSALDQQLATLRQQLDLLREEGSARSELEAIFRAQESARRDYDNGLRDSPLLSEEEIARVRSLAGAVYELNEAQKGVKATVLDVTDATKEWGDAVASVAQSGLRDIADLATGAANASQVLARLAAQLADIFLNRSGVYDSVGSLLSGLLNPYAGLSADPNGPLLGRAAGGPVTAGMPYMVGERGAELFVPNVAGSIVPNHALVGNTVVNNISVSTTGGTPAQNRQGAEAAAAAITRSLEQFFDARLTYQRRGGGMLSQPLA